VTGYSTLDELPEAIEDPGRQFVLGVQWHPEADEHSHLIAALVEEARGYRSARPPVARRVYRSTRGSS
jgi:putative glutamine amidotransferase